MYYYSYEISHALANQFWFVTIYHIIHNENYKDSLWGYSTWSCMLIISRKNLSHMSHTKHTFWWGHSMCSFKHILFKNTLARHSQCIDIFNMRSFNMSIHTKFSYQVFYHIVHNKTQIILLRSFNMLMQTKSM